MLQSHGISGYQVGHLAHGYGLPSRSGQLERLLNGQNKLLITDRQSVWLHWPGDAYFFVDHVHERYFHSVSVQKLGMIKVLNEYGLQEGGEAEEENVENAENDVLVFDLDERDQFAGKDRTGNLFKYVPKDLANMK